MAAVQRDVSEIVSDNRKNGHYLEQWAAEFLRRIHRDVQVVGNIHGGAVADKYHANATFDILGDGILYEVKGCAFRIRRSTVRSKRQFGRWKVDTHQHNRLDSEQAARMMYLLVVRVGKTPLVAYLISHAAMTDILARYVRQGRFVSLSHAVWGPQLIKIYDRRRPT